MATLPSKRGRGRPRGSAAQKAQQSKAKFTSQSTLPSWCSGFRKEALDSERAYDERVTTSTKTSEIRLRQESVRYWNRFLEEAEVAAFRKIVAPICHQIQNTLFGDFGGDGEDGGENQEHRRDYKSEKKGEGEDREMNQYSMDPDGGKNRINGDDSNIDDESVKDDVDGDWEYCQQMFGLPSGSTTAQTSTPIIRNQEEKTETSPIKSKPTSAQTPSNQSSIQIRYPFEVLPIFVITSPLISNCLQDRSKICHSMWRQLNGLECTIGTQRSPFGEPFSNNSSNDQRTICLYLPRLLSSLTETLQVIWDGLLSHYENTHDAPSMDPDDPHYYSNPNDLASKRHSYHVSKRRHYEALLDRKVTTLSQKSKIGTKKQQSLQDFVLEFLQYIYEEPEAFLEQEWHDQKQQNSITPEMKIEDEKGNSKRNRKKRGNLILLLEDPRIIHPKATTTAGQGTPSGSSGKPNNSNVVQSQLLETLAVWREMHGIPVSLVVFHSVGSKHEIQQNNVLLNPSFESSANGGRFGIQMNRFSIPSAVAASSSISIPASMAFGVWSHYFLQATMDNPLPLLAPQRCLDQHTNESAATEMVLHICRDALQNESSCSKWVSSIRARLALNFYARKGSFVWDALNPNTTAMMKGTPLLPEISLGNGSDVVADSNSNSNSGIDKDRKHFASGNDDVQIFQPEFVAWFCSYHKAHTLFSSQAGGHNADMTLSDKCEALLKCYRLLRPPVESKEQKNLRKNPSKRQKVSNGEYRARDSNGRGNLQFWWSISCSLLPLYFLSLTVANEGMILSSTVSSSGRFTSNGSSKRHNDRLLEGESRWILERLAEVYKQLLTMSEEIGTCDTNLDSTISMGNGIGGKAMIELTEQEKSVTPTGHTKDSVTKESIRESSENNDESRYERVRNQDFVESTLKRYMQRGIQECTSETIRNRDSLAATDGATAIEEVHQRGIRKLKITIQEFIVLIAAFSTNHKSSSFSTGNKEEDLIRDDKIRLGMTETILEMNLLALGQVEAWTRQWVEFNPLMTVSSVEKAHAGSTSCDNINELSSIESRPVNLRRRVLDNLPVGSRQLYEALDGRLSIDREDWYHAFGGTIEDFVVGIWTLRKCGLIRPKKTITAIAAQKHERGKAKKRQEVVSYEKVAVVWC